MIRFWAVLAFLFALKAFAAERLPDLIIVVQEPGKFENPSSEYCIQNPPTPGDRARDVLAACVLPAAIISQADSPLPGPGDAIAVATLAGGALAAGVVYVVYTTNELWKNDSAQVIQTAQSAIDFHQTKSLLVAKRTPASVDQIFDPAVDPSLEAAYTETLIPFVRNGCLDDSPEQYASYFFYGPQLPNPMNSARSYRMFQSATLTALHRFLSRTSLVYRATTLSQKIVVLRETWLRNIERILNENGLDGEDCWKSKLPDETMWYLQRMSAVEPKGFEKQWLRISDFFLAFTRRP
jgi:hypothetical protein